MSLFTAEQQAYLDNIRNNEHEEIVGMIGKLLKMVEIRDKRITRRENTREAL